MTVGQLFTPLTDCSGGGTILQQGVDSGNSYVVPSPGVITSWSFEDGATTVPGLEFKVARHVTGNDYTIVGSTAAGSQTPNAVGTYPTQISVQTGDIIGLFAGGGTCGTNTHLPGDVFLATLATDQGLNSTTTYNASSGSGNGRFPVQAKLEPDADGDGFGDETQDQCPTNPSTHGPCPPPPDTTPPSVTASIAKALKLSKSGSISFTVTVNENATGTATGTISVPKAAKLVRFKTATLNLTGGKRTKVTLKLSKRGLKTVRKALKHHRLKAKITVTLKDAAGNQAPVKKLTATLRH